MLCKPRVCKQKVLPRNRRREQNADGAGDGIKDMGDIVHQRTDDACVGVCVRGDLAELIVVFLEARLRLFLVGKDLDDLLPFHHFFDVAVDGSQLMLLLFEVPTALAGDAAHDVEDAYAHADHDKHDRDGQGRHQPEHEDQRRDRDQHLRD